MEKSDLVLFETESGDIAIDVYMAKESVWLSLNQLAMLFARDKSVISKHLKGIFNRQELHRASVVAFFATTASDGKVYNVEHFNLDAILSVGYRVNSQRGVQFRQWASKVLNHHLLKGYSINQHRLDERTQHEMIQVLSVMSKTLKSGELVNDIGHAVLNIITEYTKTWTTLGEFDEDSIIISDQTTEMTLKDMLYEDVIPHIIKLRDILILKGEASKLFGLERDDGLNSILANVRQTFDSEAIYRSNKERAAHILYFVIKDHPFVDGNKRIACLVFLIYLSMSQISVTLVSDQHMIALALLIAESAPAQKDIMIQLIMKVLE